MKKTFLLDLKVTDTLGAMDQIALLVRRSGWNIQDIIATRTATAGITRVVFHVEGAGEMRLLLNQLLRLECMRSAENRESLELEEAFKSFSERMLEIE